MCANVDQNMLALTAQRDLSDEDTYAIHKTAIKVLIQQLQDFDDVCDQIMKHKEKGGV